MRRSHGLVSLALLFVLQPTSGCEMLAADDAWIREPPPQAQVAAAYVRLNNTSDEAVVVERIDSTCCEHTMIHNTEYIDGRARMSHIEQIEIAAQSEIILSPGAMHLMLMRPSVRLKHGDNVSIDFSCAGATTTSIEFPVVKAR